MEDVVMRAGRAACWNHEVRTDAKNLLCYGSRLAPHNVVARRRGDIRDALEIYASPSLEGEDSATYGT